MGGISFFKSASKFSPRNCPKISSFGGFSQLRARMGPWFPAHRPFLHLLELKKNFPGSQNHCCLESSSHRTIWFLGTYYLEAPKCPASDCPAPNFGRCRTPPPPSVAAKGKKSPHLCVHSK